MKTKFNMLSLFALLFLCQCASRQVNIEPGFKPSPVTPTSGIGLSGDVLSIGVEAFFEGSNNEARFEWTSTQPMDQISEIDGTVALRPPEPEGDKIFPTDALVRIFADNILIFNRNLKAGREPVTLAISSFTRNLKGATKITVVFQQAGRPGNTKSNIELELTAIVMFKQSQQNQQNQQNQQSQQSQ